MGVKATFKGLRKYRYSTLILVILFIIFTFRSLSNTTVWVLRLHLMGFENIAIRLSDLKNQIFQTDHSFWIIFTCNPFAISTSSSASVCFIPVFQKYDGIFILYIYI